MQLCCVELDGGPQAAIHLDGMLYLLMDVCHQAGVEVDSLRGKPVAEQILAIANSPGLRAKLLEHLSQTPGLPERDIRYGVPVNGPIIGVGRNYQDHVSEGGLKLGDYPKIFFNHPNSLAAHDQDILIPKLIQKTDWEAELGVVIGRRMRRVSPEHALTYVAGFINVNDVSAREFQFDFGPAQTSFAKSMDGFCPCGPWLVTSDEIDNCQNLSVRCEVNAELMQNGHTSHMIYSVAEILSHLSTYMTLEPGYLIATGTPKGVGHFLNPPQYLQHGDVVTVSVSHLGVLRNRFVKEI